MRKGGAYHSSHKSWTIEWPRRPDTSTRTSGELWGEVCEDRVLDLESSIKQEEKWDSGLIDASNKKLLRY